MTKEELIQYCKDKGAFKEGGLLNASFIKYIKNHPEIKEQLDELISGNSISEQLFLLTKERTYCEVCGKPTKFKSYGEGYYRFCSDGCRKKSTVNKIKETNLQKYGVIAPAQNEAIKAKMHATLKKHFGVDNAFKLVTTKHSVNHEKRKKTMLERYGVEYPLQLEEIKRKVAKTNLEKYGNVFSVHSSLIQEKMRERNKKKYGVEFDTQREDVKEKIRKTKIMHTYKRLLNSDRLKNRVIPLFNLNEFEGTRKKHKFQCTKCGNIFMSDLINGSIPRCEVCYPLHVNSRNPLEDEIIDFIKSIYSGEIISNDREVLKGKELDIYLPERKLAIELNELYFHSELMNRGRNYHLNKTQECENQGIRLLHVFEDEWLEKRDLVESIISNTLGVYNISIGARKLQLSRMSTKQFFEDNHIQGYSPCSIEYALINEQEEILAAMSFKKPRYSKEADWELLRFAVKKGYHIPGAFNKLLSQFRKENMGSIITYSERRLFTGNVYRSNGFIELNPTPPSYWYTTGYKVRENRLKYQKHKIENVDPNLTEWENMQLKGYTRIWDCGNWKFLLS